MPAVLRIAQVAPPLEPVPPVAYGGTERIVYELVAELDRRGHQVTTFASGDSVVPGHHIETIPVALRPAGGGDPLPYVVGTMRQVLAMADEFDIVHSHLEWASLLLADASPVPVVSTFHGRLDHPWATDFFRDPSGTLVAISQNQASAHPEVPWTVIHNGLSLGEAPFGGERSDALCFVGRVAPEKGIVEAIEIARLAGRPLRIAAKIGTTGPEVAYNESVFQPALAAAGSDVEFLGELEGADRDRLFAESYASLMPGDWPEPFGLVAIESLACGTPIVARPTGALPEIIREGVDGFFGEDVPEMASKVELVAGLDRRAIRDEVIERFSAVRMADAYEALYREILAGREAGSSEHAERRRARSESVGARG